jgi:hypothetical protein
MHVTSICFSYFQVFHTYICKCFILMLHMFTMVSNVFQVFSQLYETLVLSISSVFLYVATATSRCFKSISCVAHGMRVKSG